MGEMEGGWEMGGSDGTMERGRNGWEQWRGGGEMGREGEGGEGGSEGARERVRERD